MYAFYKLNKDKGERFIKNHFLTEGYSKRTINRFINDVKNAVPLGRKKGSGKKPIFNTSVYRERLKKFLDHKRCVSQRKVASKLNCSTRTVSRMLKSFKKPIRCFKRTKRPKRTLLQKAFARPKCRRMYMKYRQHEFVMDDESYFTLSNTTLETTPTILVIAD